MILPTLRRSAAFASVAVLVLLSSCSGGGSDDDTTPEASATPSATATVPPVDPEQIACKLITASERQKLAGSAVDDIVAATGTDGSSQCRWQSADAVIQVTTLPAKEWAKSLPDIVTQLEQSGQESSSTDQADLAAAKKLLAGAATFTDDQACDAFATLAELGGGTKGAAVTVTAVPITDTESGLSGQTCSGGDLTSVLYSIPGLAETDAIDATLTKILGSAQKRLAREG